MNAIPPFAHLCEPAASLEDVLAAVEADAPVPALEGAPPHADSSIAPASSAAKNVFLCFMSFSSVFYILLGGVIGAFITFTVIKAMGSLGPAKAAVLIVSAQVIVAYVIEVLGMFGVEKTAFQWRNMIGLVLVIAGIAFFKWKA